MNAEARLKELGFELPEVPKPVAEYVPAKKSIEEGSLNVPAALEYVLEVSKKGSVNGQVPGKARTLWF